MQAGTEAPLFWLVIAAVVWLALALVLAWIARARLRGDDLRASAVFRLIQVYAHLVHRVRVSGLENIAGRSAGEPLVDGRPLIVVANHTAGVDPIIVQAVLPFEVRWMMAEDMRIASLEWFWELGRVIFVDRGAAGESARDMRGVREALRHLRAGGVLGVFPEGHIERPERRILPFREGIGLLVSRTGAEVLPVVVEGTPQVDPAWASLWRLSRSRVRILPALRFQAREKGAGEIADELRRVFLEATGWPANDTPPELRDGMWWYLDDDGIFKPRIRRRERRIPRKGPAR